jgi:hypothetical protein
MFREVTEAAFKPDRESFKSALESAPSESAEFSKLWDTVVVPGVDIKVEISISSKEPPAGTKPPIHIIVHDLPANKIIHLLSRKKEDRVSIASDILVATKYKFAWEVAEASRKESGEKFYRECVEAGEVIKAGEASREARSE